MNALGCKGEQRRLSSYPNGIYTVVVTDIEESHTNSHVTSVVIQSLKGRNILLGDEQRDSLEIVIKIY